MAPAISCDWSEPGLHRYEGSAASAIHAFVEIPAATRAQLVADFEARNFADFITIDRETIRGKKGNYDPAVRRMHFGSRGRICDTVDRSKWADAYVATAVVLCADGWCVAAPTICSNWFILGQYEPFPPARERVPGQPAADGPPGGVPVPPVQGGPAPGGGGGTPAKDEPPVTFGGPGPGFFWPGGGGGGGGGGYCVTCTPVCPPDTPIATPVPEPETWALMVAGLLTLGWRQRCRARLAIKDTSS